jgi:hypothetical protein
MVGGRVAISVWHEFVVISCRLIDQLCEHASVLETDNASEEGKAALDKMLISVVNGAPSSKGFDPATRTGETC